MNIRKISYAETWPLRHKVLWPAMDIDYIKLDEDPRGMHFGLFIGENLMSVVSLFQSDGSAQFRKFATDANEQKKGYGTALLSFLMEYAQNQKFCTIWCNARKDKTEFYRKFGMIKTDSTFIKSSIEYVIMKRTLGTN